MWNIWFQNQFRGLWGTSIGGSQNEYEGGPEQCPKVKAI